MIQDILSNNIWLMEATYLKHFMETVASKDLAESLAAAANNEKLFSTFFADESGKGGKPYEINNGIATINIEGPLMKKAKGFFAMLLGIQSMEKIGENFNLALADKDVHGIFLKIDSPGGSADGTQALSDIVFAGRGQKPIMSFVDSNMLSAALWIGTASDYTVVSDSISRVGSIGAVAIHREISEAAKEAGIKFTVFGSGDFKKIGNEFEALSKKDVEYLQSQIDFLHARFLDGVSKNLGIPVSKIHKDARESKIFLGQQGIDAGIAHEILTKEKALAKLRTMINNSPVKFTKTKIKTVRSANQMNFENFGLKEILMEIQKTEDVEPLAKLEEALSAECRRRLESAQNWQQEGSAKLLSDQCRELCSRQRRAILSRPAAEKRSAEYQLGRAIGKSA